MMLPTDDSSRRQEAIKRKRKEIEFVIFAFVPPPPQKIK